MPHPQRWLAPLAVVMLALLLLAAERLWPLRVRRRPLRERLSSNLLLAVLAYAMAVIAVRPSAVVALSFVGHRGIGLLASLPRTPRFLIGFVLADLTFYWWHRANHLVPVLWRFHVVHHVDPDLDVTTAPRFHPGEIALSAAFQAAHILVLGLDATTWIAYQIALQAETYVHHSNVRLPPGLERALNLIFVTPRMHGIHHSQRRGETDANWSVVFSWWDRLHRTFVPLNGAQPPLVIGVPAYDEPLDNRPAALVGEPFRHQRVYWNTAASSTKQPDEQ